MNVSASDTLAIEVISGANSNPVELDIRARMLLREIRQVPRVSADLGKAEPSGEGAKSVATVAPAIVVALGFAGQVLPSIITKLGDWMSRQPQSTTISLKVGERTVEWSGPNPPPELLETMLASLAQMKG